AAVSVRAAGTNATRTAQSTISNLAPGVYDVTIGRSGFPPAHESGLELQVQQTARIDARLQVGAVSETVEVTAHVPLINTETSSRRDVITSQELAEMPLNGRDFNDLAFLVPGVQPAEQGGKGSAYVANGARADASNVVIDGLNDQNPRDAGTHVRTPGRRRTNQFHGSLFECARNDLFDARNFFDAGKSELGRNQFGATVGGPLTLPKLYIVPDSAFRFGNPGRNILDGPGNRRHQSLSGKRVHHPKTWPRAIPLGGI
ncbi:MAG: carboxypeptidase-like regulatory domain-containing protein, partial [Bryobacteraceae bacterium]